MASQKNGSHLEEALAILIQNQAQFLGRLADNDARFARIEKQMAAIMNVLAEHSRLLERLPEAVREKIGFKAK